MIELDGTYYGSKKKDYDKDLQACIEEAGQFCLDRLPERNPDFQFPTFDKQSLEVLKKSDEDDSLLLTGQGTGNGKGQGTGNGKGQGSGNGTGQNSAQTNLQPYEPLMLLGKVQSGKTKAFCGLIALAFDNDVDIVFVLTKNDSLLTDQTVARMRDEFSNFPIQKNVVVEDIFKFNPKSRLSNQKLIVVCKKQKHNLAKLLEFVEKYKIPREKRTLLIDDEADSGGVGFAFDEDSDIPELRTIATGIDSLILSLNLCPWVQVTATPYALFLQPDFSLESEILPKRPAHCVLVPYGPDYVGGVDYFLNSRFLGDPNYYLCSVFSTTEGEIVTSKGGTHTTGVDSSRILEDTHILQVFKQGIVNFIMGTILMHHWYGEKDEDGKNINYSYLIHTAQQIEMHTDLQIITEEFLHQIQDRQINSAVRLPIIDVMLRNSYSDLKLSVEAHGKTMLPFDEMKDKFFIYVDSDVCSATVVNSKENNDNFMDKKEGELILKSFCSIFIGGQKLDRGLTIPSMLGFYYGRNPQVMQQDTVIQHSRMYGYRRKFMPVTRFYCTSEALEKLTDMTEADESLREKIATGNQGDVYFIPVNQKKDTKEVIPSSGAKTGNFTSQLHPGKRILPVGLDASGAHAQVTPQIDAIFATTVAKKNSYHLSTKQVRDLIELSYQSIQKDPESKRYIEKDEFMVVFEELIGSNSSMDVVLKRGKKTGKYRTQINKNGQPLFMDAPDNGQVELKEAKELAIATPALILLEHTGVAAGWKTNDSFWWPILVVHKDFGYHLYAQQKAIEARRNSSF